MLLYIGGVTHTVLCDNLKTADTKSDRYERTFTDLCYQLSEYYQTTFSATRPGNLRDKALVERLLISFTAIFMHHSLVNLYFTRRNSSFRYQGCSKTLFKVLTYSRTSNVVNCVYYDG
jgi:hypothetical protein